MILAFLLRNWLPVALSALLAVATLTAGVERSRRQHIQQQFAEARAQASEALAKWEAYQRQEESRRAAAVTEARNEAVKELEKLRSDASRANDTAGRLRIALDLAAKSLKACGSSAPAGGSETTAPVGDVLTELLERMEQRGRAMAEAADRSRISGQACQRSYESLTTSR